MLAFAVHWERSTLPARAREHERSQVPCTGAEAAAWPGRHMPSGPAASHVVDEVEAVVLGAGNRVRPNV